MVKLNRASEYNFPQRELPLGCPRERRLNNLSDLFSSSFATSKVLVPIHIPWSPIPSLNLISSPPKHNLGYSQQSRLLPTSLLILPQSCMLHQRAHNITYFPAHDLDYWITIWLRLYYHSVRLISHQTLLTMSNSLTTWTSGLCLITHSSSYPSMISP